MRVSGTYSLASAAYSSSMKSPLVSPCAISRSAQESPDAVGHVHYVVAGLEIGEVGGERCELRLAGRRLGNQVGSIEKIFRSEDGDAGLRERHAAPNMPSHQQRAGSGAGNVRTLGQIRARGIRRIETELIRNRIFLENIRQPFQFADGFRKEDHAIALLHQVARFGHRGLYVAVESERGTGRGAGGWWLVTGGWR